VPKDMSKEAWKEEETGQLKNFVLAVFTKCIKVEQALNESLNRKNNPNTMAQMLQ
jgi:hypothetical protein